MLDSDVFRIELPEYCSAMAGRRFVDVIVSSDFLLFLCLLAGLCDGGYFVFYNGNKIVLDVEYVVGGVCDLDAALDLAAPVHWLHPGSAESDPALPDGVTSLASLVDAPSELQRRPKQIGLVDAAQGGKGGGGAQITEFGREVLKEFRAVEAGAVKAVAKAMPRFAKLLRASPPRGKLH